MASNEGPRTFIFLDGTKKGHESKAVRSHVLRGFWKEERHRRIRGLLAKPPLSLPHRAGGRRRERSARDEVPTTAEPKDNVKTSRSQAPKAQSEPTESRITRTPKTVSQVAAAQNRAKSLPLTIERDLIEIDPFDTLPLKLDRPGQALAHTNRILMLEPAAYGSWTAFARQGLALTYTSKMVFCNSLSLTSAYLDANGGGGESCQTLMWKTTSISYLNQLIADPMTRYDFEVMAGIMGSLIFQMVNANFEACNTHSRGLAQLIRHRGGYHASFGSSAKDIYMLFVHVQMSKASIAYLDQIQPGAVGARDEVLEWKQEHDHFIAKMKELSLWVTQTQRLGNSNGSILGQSFRWLSELLVPAHDVFIGAEQMFLLCYLALALHEHRDSAQAPENFLQLLTENCQQLGPRFQLPNVLWIIFQDIDGASMRKYQALRLVRLMHRLSEKTKSKIEAFLSGIVIAGTGASTARQPVLTHDDLLVVSQEALAGLPHSLLA